MLSGRPEPIPSPRGVKVEGGQDPSGSRLSRFVASLTPAVRDAAAELVSRLATHVRRPLGRGAWCTELCPAYLAATGVAHATAARAWDAVRRIVGWVELRVDDARRLLGGLRRLRSGERWGRHVVLTDDAVSQLRAAALDLGRPSEPAGAVPVAVAWSRRGDGWTCCPWHAERRPSLHLLASGAAHCFGCDRTGRWLRVGAGVVVAPAIAPGQQVRDGGHTRRAEGPDPAATRPRPATPESTPSEPVARLTIRNGRATTTRSRLTDLLDVVERWDRTADGRLARYGVADEYAATGPSVVTSWTQVRAAWIPSGRATTAARWIAVDLDGPDGLRMLRTGWAGRVIRASVGATPGATGAGFVVRTSGGCLQVAVEVVRPVPVRALPPVASATGIAAEAAARAEGFDVRADGAYLGRLVRLPGWRIAKDGSPFRVHVAGSTPRR